MKQNKQQNNNKQQQQQQQQKQKPAWIVGKSQLATQSWLVVTNIDSNQAQVKKKRAQQEVW